MQKATIPQTPPNPTPTAKQN